MKCMIHWGNQYLEESDWKTIALLKLCVCAAGVMIGLKVPKQKKPVSGCVAFSVFMACCVPLVWKLVEIVKRSKCGE